MTPGDLGNYRSQTKMFNTKVVYINFLYIGGAGIQGVDVNTTCPTFADDISVVTRYKPHLQSMLNAAYKHSCLLSYDFINPNKYHVLVYGRDTSPSRQLYLGNDVINVVACERHLGVPISSVSDKLTTAVYDRINIGSKHLPHLVWVTVIALYLH